MLEQDTKYEHKIILTDIGYKKDIGLKDSKLIIGKVSTFKLFDFIRLNKLLKQHESDLVILHSGHLNFLLLSFCFNKKLLHHTILSLWGGQDCRKFKVPKEKIIFLPFGIVYEFLRKSIYKNVKAINALLESDYLQVKDAYHFNCERLVAPYPFIPNINSDKEKHDSFNIQVCHSGSIYMNTLELLDELSIYKDENIKIYAGLSYDDPINIKAILEKGNKIFKDKFIPITEYMNPEQYANYVNNLDMMIFNSDIQQGLANAYLGFASGVKIVYKKNSVLYNFFKKDKFVFSTVEEILKDKKKLYKKLTKEEIKNNYDKAYVMFDIDKQLKNWYQVFDK